MKATTAVLSATGVSETFRSSNQPVLQHFMHFETTIVATSTY
jgi:ABC-type amino acid transport system permease subunit